MADDIQAAMQAAIETLRRKERAPEFTGVTDPIAAMVLRLQQALEGFLAGGVAGTAAQLAAAGRVRDSAAAMTPDAGSVTRTEAAVKAAADALSPARGGLLSALRGSLRIARAPIDRPTQADRPFGAAIAATTSTEAPSPTTRAAAGNDAAGDPDYYRKLTNLFPAEALALYGTGVALYGAGTWPVVLVTLAVLLLLRLVATQPRGGGRPQPVAVAVAAVSFLLWATATDPTWLIQILHTGAPDAIRHSAAFGGAALVVVAPLVVKVPPDGR